MAVRGSDYKMILEHYYPGIALTKMASDAPAAAGSP
jgi:peptidoglycan hydrolase-like amidase